MNYTDIKTLSLGYSNRDDTDVIGKMDFFILMVESIINTELDTRRMAHRLTLNLEDGREYYCLPADFRGMRDIEVYVPDEDGNKPAAPTTTLHYLNPPVYLI